MISDALRVSQHFLVDAYDVIVVGTGPVGIHAVREIKKLIPEASIAVFGDEPWQPYNRVRLSSLVSGEVGADALYEGETIETLTNVRTFYNDRIIEVDRENRIVTDEFGCRYSYDHLVLATGSHAHVPVIPGVDLENVFTLRDMSDAEKLMGRSVRTRRTVVIGGGLLGLEAARAMQRFNTEVHVVEHSKWLMFKQLDEYAGALLNNYVKGVGIHVHCDARIKAIEGDGKVEAISFASGELIECDTVVIATGIVPNRELAANAGLPIGRGIRVDDQMQTRDPYIYAIGECAEHADKIYGLVAPGLEQASVMAHAINGEKVNYLGSVSATNLKVLDLQVFSAGDFDGRAFQRDIVIYEDLEKGIYRKLIVTNGRLRAAMGIGDWPGVQRIQEAVEKKRRIWFWQIRRFREEGIIWNDAAGENVVEWPATATVCNCTGVTRGQLDAALLKGNVTVEALAECTGASTVCGSCKCLLSDYVGGSAKPEPARGYPVLLGAAFLTLLSILAMALLPSWPYSDSVQTGFSLDILWRDGFYKQLSGFTLLGLSALISVISFRKRIGKLLRLWDYAAWRVVHVVFGAVTIAVLLAHTGFRLGDNLNFYLMLVFSALLLVGGVASWVTGYEHSLPTRLAKQLRLYAVWSHILLLWPLPALLGFHVLKTYYF